MQLSIEFHSSVQLFHLFFFFFFQAEDGIRDTSVTGVQTCALPILASRAVLAWDHPRRTWSIPKNLEATLDKFATRVVRPGFPELQRIGQHPYGPSARLPAPARLVRVRLSRAATRGEGSRLPHARTACANPIREDSHREL